MSKKSFVGGAVILGAAGLVVKLMGAVFRIPVTNWLGGGMAYYQAAYPIYNILLTLATAGIPVAISRMVAERTVVGDHYAANNVFKVSFRLLGGIGLGTGLLCLVGANWYANQIGLPETAYALRALIPALVLIPIMSAYRGYFQGMQNMNPTAVSQIIEQVFRVGIGLALTKILLDRFAENPEYAAAGATFGASAGAIGGLLVVWLIYMANRKVIIKKINRGRLKTREKSGDITKKILIIAIPITLGACIMPFMNLIDASIVSNRLQDIGFSYSEAKNLFTELSSMAGTVVNFPQIIVQSIAISLVPAISMAFREKDGNGLKINVQMGMRMANILSFPCAAGLIILAEPVLVLLYRSQYDMAVDAAGSLMMLAFGFIFLAIAQTLTGALQGIGKQLIPVRNLIIGAVFKTIITYMLVGVESLNVIGAAIGTCIAYMIAAVLDIMAIKKYTGVRFNIIQTFIKPIIATLAMSVMTIISYNLAAKVLGNSMAVLVSIILSAAVYAVMLFATKTITAEEAAMIPGGNKLVKIMGKFIK